MQTAASAAFVAVARTKRELEPRFVMSYDRLAQSLPHSRQSVTDLVAIQSEDRQNAEIPRSLIWLPSRKRKVSLPATRRRSPTFARRHAPSRLNHSQLHGSRLEACHPIHISQTLEMVDPSI